MRLRTIWFSAIALGAFALLSGCGGSSGGDTGPVGGGSSYSAEIALGGTETGTLTVVVDGTTATGTLVRDAAKGRDFPSVPAGTTNLTGTFTAPAGFALSGTMSGGKPLQVTGTLPGDETAGTYQLKSGADTLSGGLLPKGVTKPTMAFSAATVSLEPGEARGLSVETAHFPSGIIKYRYFIAAPTAGFRNSDTPPVTGQDITVSQKNVTLQTGVADSGKLKAYCQAYLEKDGVRTFLAQAVCSVELVDVTFVDATWVEEVGTNPQGNVDYHSYCWEFPVVTGAKEYIVSRINVNNGSTTLRYRIHQGDIEATENGSTPIYFGALPHSFPPVIPVTEELTGQSHDNFFRRGNSVRMLIVVTDPGLEGPYRTNNPITVKVYK